MGIHVTRTSRGVVLRYFRHAGERVRRTLGQGKGTGASSKAQSGVKTGGSAGTRGDFGADFE